MSLLYKLIYKYVPLGYGNFLPQGLFLLINLALLVLRIIHAIYEGIQASAL